MEGEANNDIVARESQEESKFSGVVDESLLMVNNRSTHLEYSLAKAFDENAAWKEKPKRDRFIFLDEINAINAKELVTVLQNQKQKEKLDKAISEKTALEELYRNTLEQLNTTQTSLKQAKEVISQQERTFQELRRSKEQSDAKREALEFFFFIVAIMLFVGIFYHKQVTTIITSDLG